ncbi:MAG: hypothetical protein JOZ42_16220 [Acetobacteraceae bacterium]|nr:hypothetical protein [Acetobacteraceae bacterium]
MEPGALPPVLKRDLEIAWQAANVRGALAPPDVARAFRFCRPDGSVTDFAVADSDARSWASAVDRAIGLHTNYGLSLCLRLLALVDLLARARSAARLLSVDRQKVEVHPSVLRAAACAPLDDTGRFDEARFMTRVSEFLSSPGGIYALPAGVRA